MTLERIEAHQMVWPIDIGSHHHSRLQCELHSEEDAVDHRQAARDAPELAVGVDHCSIGLAVCGDKVLLVGQEQTGRPVDGRKPLKQHSLATLLRGGKIPEGLDERLDRSIVVG